MDQKLLEQRLSETRSRGQVKALGLEVDGDPALREALMSLARKRGLSVEPGLGGRRLVRAVLNRSGAARQRTNPVRRDPGFTCVHCGAQVEPGGSRVRDHCPECLHGLHVDAVPGDRSSECRGLLVPIELNEGGREGTVIHYECASCGMPWRTRAHPGDRMPGRAPDQHQEAVEGVGLPYERARTLPRRVLEHVRREKLWDPGMRVVLSVSGGLDSSVLLELLWRLEEAHKGQLEVVSFDHGLRPESSHEVAVVGRRVRELGLPFFGLQLELATGAGLQERARDARRDALVARGADRIATGHHLDDQAETVLFNLLRGAGSTGLKGIRPCDPPWVRPLLEEPRAVLEAWARAEGVHWVEDPSNAMSMRGQMRSLVPHLALLREDPSGGLARSARLLGRDDAFLEQLADRLWEPSHSEGRLHWQSLQAEHPALQLRILRRLVAEAGACVGAAQLEQVLQWGDTKPRQLDLPEGGSLLLEEGVMWVQKTSE